MNYTKILKHQKLQFIVLFVLVFELAFPFQVAGASIEQNNAQIKPNLVIKAANPDNQESHYTAKSEAKMSVFLAVPRREYKVLKTLEIPVTAYNSLPEQTDSTPCHTANGFDLCAHNQEDVIATNFLPFGTKVRMPELFGDRIFTVQDRMNARYHYRADIWMKSRPAAVKFGLVYTKIEVVE